MIKLEKICEEIIIDSSASIDDATLNEGHIFCGLGFTFQQQRLPNNFSLEVSSCKIHPPINTSTFVLFCCTLCSPFTLDKLCKPLSILVD